MKNSSRVVEHARLLAALYRLGVEPPVTAASILRAYREQVKANHPDRVQSESEKRTATARLQEINAARDYINAHLRDALAFGLDEPSAASPPPLHWIREDCVHACREYERIWPADPRD